jgi:hypothetical protein
MLNSTAYRRAIFYIWLALYGMLGLAWGPNLFGHHGLFEDRPFDYLGVLLSGWINPTFLIAAGFASFRPSARITRILGITTLAMIPFCWVVFYYHHFYPREGHFVWIAGMLLVFFARLNPAMRSTRGHATHGDRPL